MSYSIIVIGSQGQELMNDIFSEDYIFSSVFHQFLDGEPDMTFEEFLRYLGQNTDIYQFFI